MEHYLTIGKVWKVSWLSVLQNRSVILSMVRVMCKDEMFYSQMLIEVVSALARNAEAGQICVPAQSD